MKAFVAMALLLVGACSQLPESPVSGPVSAERLRAHVEFLADDRMRGRDTGSPEYAIAANYVAAEFAKLGLAPAGENGSFFQSVPMVEARLVEGSARARIVTPAAALELSYPGQFMSGPSTLAPTQAVSAELVFVGYGIVAPGYDHDDYAGLDVEGKIAVMLTGRPESWPTEEGAHLGGGDEKARHAVENGAIGRIVIHTPRAEKTFPYEDQFKYLGVPTMDFVDADGVPDGAWPQLRGGAYLHPEAAAPLFDGAPMSLDALLQADLEGRELQRFALESSAALSRKSTQRRFSSRNVVAVLEGSDPVLKNEYVLYTAHLDHLGVIDNEEGAPEIYNGAMDNAAGIAVMLETARALADENLKRSVLFIAVTGEEHGLLGSGYYAKNPTVPIESIIANVNLDMPLFLYPFADVVAFGAEHSDLATYVSRAANEEGISLSPDPIPEQAIFVRSDHYPFVKQGVPAVFLVTGFTSRDPGQAFGEVFQHFLATHYHQPSDDLSLAIDYEGGALFTEININIGCEVANSESRPQWHADSFFGKTFGAGR